MPRQFLAGYIDAISDSVGNRSNSHAKQNHGDEGRAFVCFVLPLKDAISSILEFDREASARPRDSLPWPLTRQLFETDAV